MDALQNSQACALQSFGLGPNQYDMGATTPHGNYRVLSLQ